MAQVTVSLEMKNYEDKKDIVTLHNKGWVIMIIFTPSIPICYLIQPLLQNKEERVCIPFQLDSKGNCKMTTLFLSHVYHIPYDTYVRNLILFRDTLINVSSLRSFFFSQTVRQGNVVTHARSEERRVGKECW